MSRVRRVVGKAVDLVYTVTEEPLPDGTFRTVSIEGPIRVVPGRAPHSGTYRSPFDHHGHLIADQLGGPGAASSGNVVAMHGHANNGSGGEYRAMERAVVAFLAGGQGRMRVVVGYKGATDIRPHVFVVDVTYPNGMHSRWRIFNFYPGYPNPHERR